MSTAVLLTIFLKENRNCTWKSKWLLDTEMSNVLDLFTKSSLLDMRAQNKINCLLGPTKSPTNIMMVLKNNVLENNCKEIVEELLWTNHSLWWQNLIYLLRLGLGDTIFSWLACSTPQGAVRVQALAVCCVLGEDTLPSHCSTQVFKWVPANLILGCNPQMD